MRKSPAGSEVVLSDVIEWYLSQAPSEHTRRVLARSLDAINEIVFHNVNNGVYKAGFATTQAEYEHDVDALFEPLDDLETRPAVQRFLVGDRLTEADIRLFTTLVRFDAVYHGHFKCNLRRRRDYPNLWVYARDLYQRPNFGSTVDFDHVKRRYHLTHHRLNPIGIVPKGPNVDWLAPYGRHESDSSGARRVQGASGSGTAGETCSLIFGPPRSSKLAP